MLKTIINLFMNFVGLMVIVKYLILVKNVKIIKNPFNFQIIMLMVRVT